VGWEIASFRESPNGSTLTGVDPHAEEYETWDDRGAGATSGSALS
jgi:hypothetical protein